MRPRFVGLAGLLALCCNASLQAQSATPSETRAIARDAYTYAYPMLESYNTWHKQAVDAKAPEYVGGFNRYRHYSQPYTAANHDIVTPNNDTPYSWAWLDLKQVHALQDAIQVTQAQPGKLELPNWDAASQKQVRDALLVLASTLPDFRKSFGTPAQVDAVRHLVGTAAAWGGNPDKDATYLNVTPAKNDGTTVYRLNVKDVPVDSFWSVSVYNAKGYFEKNPEGAYTVNSITGKPGGDGSIAIQFGGCDAKVANCLPVTPGWNYTVRLYRPRAEILDGRWSFPQPTAVQ